MDVGVGLPAGIPRLEREQLLEWARRAEARGFSSLGTLDRLVHQNWEPLAALAAAAAVTERIALWTSILIAPLRDTALLAKQAATVDQLSGGRLVLGLAPGGRQDDFDAAGAEFAGRGARLERQLGDLRRHWKAARAGGKEAVGPAPVLPDGPAVMIGGKAPASFRRAARESGWVMGGGPVEQFTWGAEQVRAAWRRAGRGGEPRLASLGYFSLGPDAERNALAYLGDYYAWIGREAVDSIVARTLVDREAVRAELDAFEDAGCGELILFPCSADPAQVDLLADACAL